MQGWVAKKDPIIHYIHCGARLEKRTFSRALIFDQMRFGMFLDPDIVQGLILSSSLGMAGIYDQRSRNAENVCLQGIFGSSKDLKRKVISIAI